MKSLETQVQEHLKNYFIIKNNLFAAALFFYVYTGPQQSFQQAVEEILARKRAAKIEANLTYFVKCSEVRDPLIVFSPEFFPLWEEAKKYYCLTLAREARKLKKSYLLSKLNEHQRIIYEILEKERSMFSGRLYRMYRSKVEKPMCSRAYRNMMRKMVRLEIIGGERCGRWRKCEVLI